MYQKLQPFIEYFNRPYFSFVNSLGHININEIQKIKKLVNQEENDFQDRFEKNFSKLIGSGSSVSFASGRMGFYALMKILEIQKDDEIIILGATCSVMVNAILKCGARPVYSDINKETFGSDSKNISKSI